MTVKDPTIVVQVAGETIVFVGTPEQHVIQSDNKELVALVKANMERTKNVPMIHGMGWKTFPTGKTTYMEIAAAMFGVSPHQSILLTAPDEVVEALKVAQGETGFGTIY